MRSCASLPKTLTLPSLVSALKSRSVSPPLRSPEGFRPWVGVGQLLRELSQREALDSDERAVLSDLVNLLNNAVHGATIDPRASRWAIEVGPRLLKTLDERVTKSRAGS